MSWRTSSIPGMLVITIILVLVGVAPAKAQEPGNSIQAATRAISAIHERLLDAGTIQRGGGIVIAEEMIGEGFGPAGVDRGRALRFAEGFAQRVASIEDVLVCTADAPRMRNCSLDAEIAIQLGALTTKGRMASLPIIVVATSPEGMVFMQMRKLTLERERDGWRVVDDELVGGS